MATVVGVRFRCRPLSWIKTSSSRRIIGTQDRWTQTDSRGQWYPRSVSWTNLTASNDDKEEDYFISSICDDDVLKLVTKLWTSPNEKSDNVNKPPTIHKFIDEKSNEEFCKMAATSVGGLRLPYIFDWLRFLIFQASIDGAPQKVVLKSLQPSDFYLSHYQVLFGHTWQTRIYHASRRLVLATYAHGYSRSSQHLLRVLQNAWIIRTPDTPWVIYIQRTSRIPRNGHFRTSAKDVKRKQIRNLHEQQVLEHYIYRTCLKENSFCMLHWRSWTIETCTMASLTSSQRTADRNL